MIKIKQNILFIKALVISVLFVCNYNPSFAQSKTIELVHSDKLTNALIFKGAIKVTGNVHFKHDSKNLYCDSAYFHQTENWIRAYNNVQINQGDTLNLFCDSLYFDGNTNIGVLKSNVRFRDNEFKLTTDSLKFDANNSIGYYSNWAKITSINQDLNLTSKKGYYYSNSKTFFFKDSVNVIHPNYELEADTLEFRTNTQTVFFHGPTIIKLDSTKVLCNKGYYETSTEFLNLWNGATIINNSTSTLYADSLIYNQSAQIAEGFYNVSIYDSLENVQLKSDYLKKYQYPEKVILKNNARIYQYNEKDTLFMRADSIYQSKDSISNKNISIAINNVILINSGAVGICDSIYYNEADSIIHLRKEPILWHDKTQLLGDSINIKLIDNNFDKIKLLSRALIVTKHDSIHFDQLAGKTITAQFKKKEIDNVLIQYNAQTLYYPNEKTIDSMDIEQKKLIGKNFLECNEIYIYFKLSEIQKIKFIDKPEASFFPIDQIPEKDLFLQSFIWKIEQKPSTIIPK